MLGEGLLICFGFVTHREKIKPTQFLNVFSEKCTNTLAGTLLDTPF